MPDDGPWEGPKHVALYWYKQYRIIIYDGSAFSDIEMSRINGMNSINNTFFPEKVPQKSPWVLTPDISRMLNPQKYFANYGARAITCNILWGGKCRVCYVSIMFRQTPFYLAPLCSLVIDFALWTGCDVS